MKLKYVCLALIIWLVATLTGVSLTDAGIVQAQDSERYNLALNTMAGGNYGGSIHETASYTIVLGSGVHIGVSTSSAGFELCSGFVCQANHTFFQLHIPALLKE